MAKLKAKLSIFFLQPVEKSKAAESVTPGDKTSIIFTLNNHVGGLAKALQVFQELGINVLHLELQNNNANVEHVNLTKTLLISIYIISYTNTSDHRYIIQHTSKTGGGHCAHSLPIIKSRCLSINSQCFLNVFSMFRFLFIKERGLHSTREIKIHK